MASHRHSTDWYSPERLGLSVRIAGRRARPCPAASIPIPGHHVQATIRPIPDVAQTNTIPAGFQREHCEINLETFEARNVLFTAASLAFHVRRHVLH